MKAGEEFAAELLESFKDGFQFEDIVTVAEVTLDHTAGEGIEEPEEFCVDAISYVIDNTDTPWLPDSLSDPLMKAFVPRLVEWAFRLAARPAKD